MPSRVRSWLLGIGLTTAVVFAGGCKKETRSQPPTPEQVRTGIEESAERVRNNPNMTAQQKEQALRLLEGMKAAAQQQRNDE